MRDGPRRTETTCVTPACVAPRHVDAPRDFLIFYFIIFIFSPNEQRAGGGGRGALPDFFFFFFSLFSRPRAGLATV